MDMKNYNEDSNPVAKDFELVPLSPMSDKFLNLMLSYAKGIFDDIDQLKEHIIRDSFIEVHSPADTPKISYEGSNFQDSQAANRLHHN